jgi:competence protein ComEC
LIDCASRREWSRVVEPFLRHEGINRLNGLILSHGDSAHIGAAPLARQLSSPRIHTSVLDPWTRDSKLTAMRQLAVQVPVDSMQWHRHELGQTIQLGSGAKAEVLHPLVSDRENRADDRAMVLLLHLHRTRVLMLSDAGFMTIQLLRERYPNLRCDVIVRGQNTANPGSLEDLIESTGARAIISSNHKYDVNEIIPQELRDQCRAQQLRLVDLLKDGCAHLQILEDGARLTTYRDQKVMELPAIPSALPNTQTKIIPSPSRDRRSHPEIYAD